MIESLLPGSHIVELRRMGGGASKEQFSFTVRDHSGLLDRYVLRMEPVQSISESDRRREVELLAAVRGKVPAPEPVWVTAVRTAISQTAAAIEQLIQASGEDGGEEFSRQSARLVIAYGKRASQRDRSWFAGTGFEAADAELLSLEECLQRARTAESSG